MRIRFRESFAKDISGLRDKKLVARIRAVIELVESASDVRGIAGFKKLRGKSNYYRIRIAQYRIGLVIDKNEVMFVRVLHRKDIYRHFP